MQIPILSGIYVDQVADFRTSYPRNFLPVPKQQGISQGYLGPADGLVQFGTGPGVDRGGFNWQGTCFRVMGTSLCRVATDGTVTALGDVGGTGQVTMDESFDVLAIWSGGRLFYWDGSALTSVADPDLGTVIDGRWIGGYFLSTDGTYLVVTELLDRYAVNPLKYGSAEADPDTIKAVDELRNEAYAFGRYTVEVFDNVGGENFPFQRIPSAMVPRGILGTHTYTAFAETFAFLGSGKNEAAAVWLMGPGTTGKLSTREIDMILEGYTEAQLSAAVVESRVGRGHQLLLIHLPDRCLVYDHAATLAVQEPCWATLDSGLLTPETYKARGHVWCYDRWIAGDPTGTAVVGLDRSRSDHLGQVIGWDFGCQILYNEGRGAVIQSLELVSTPGRVPLGADPTIWTSYTLDGETWSQERPIQAGKQGQREKRLCWRRQGSLKNYRIQRFRGTSDAHLAIARLEAQMEPLYG